MRNNALAAHGITLEELLHVSSCVRMLLLGNKSACLVQSMSLSKQIKPNWEDAVNLKLWVLHLYLM